MISFGIDFIFKIFVFMINVACFSIWISSVKENHLLWPLYFKMVLEMKFIDEAKYLSFCMESIASFLAWHSCKYHIPSGCYRLCLCLSYNWTFSLLLSYIYAIHHFHLLYYKFLLWKFHVFIVMALKFHLQRSYQDFVLALREGSCFFSRMMTIKVSCNRKCSFFRFSLKENINGKCAFKKKQAE